MAAIKLGNVDIWEQIPTNATSQQQLSLQCLIISILSADGKIDTIIVPSCIYLDDKISETTVDRLFNKVGEHHFLFTLLHHNININ